MRQAKYKDSTIHSSLDFFKASVNQAIENQKITRNPNIEKFLNFRKHLKKTEYQTIPNERDDTFSDERLERVIDNCKSDAMILMLKITSRYPTRFSELRKLRLDQFSVINGNGFLSLEAMKNGNKRDIGLCQEITNDLQTVKESKVNGETHFFTDENGKLLSANHLYNHFNTARKRANVKECFHQLRQKSCTNCFRAGLDMKTIMILGGWRTEKMCLRYYKPKASDLARVGDVIENYLKTKLGHRLLLKLTIFIYYFSL